MASMTSAPMEAPSPAPAAEPDLPSTMSSSTDPSAT
jgi:hypothetical protein